MSYTTRHNVTAQGNRNPWRSGYQHTPRVAGPLTKPRMRRRNIAWAVLAVLLVLAFDHMMRADQARLCASDAAMMQGCGE